MLHRLLTAAALLVLLSAPARAGCLYKPFEFHPEKNDGVVVDVIVDAGSFCTHNFGGGQGYTFTSISFVHEPEHGRLVQDGTNRFIYTPDKGFTGKDAYVFRNSRHQGCAERLLDSGLCVAGEVGRGRHSARVCTILTMRARQRRAGGVTFISTS